MFGYIYKTTNKDVFLYCGSRSYKKNLDAMERYPNYRVVKLDNTELTR